MREVLLEVCLVGGEQLRVAVDHEQVFGVARLGLLREIEAARDDRPPVDKDHLDVGDRMLGIDEAGNVTKWLYEMPLKPIGYATAIEQMWSVVEKGMK